MAQSSTPTFRFRPGLAAGVLVTALAGIVIGCGGSSGSGGLTSATNSTSFPTTTNPTTSNPTTTNPTTANPTNGTPGNLPQDVVVYTEGVGAATEIRTIKQDGSQDALYASIPQLYRGFGIDPSRANVKLFGYHTAADEPYGIYRNTTINREGATEIVPPTYGYVDQIQVSPDGSTIYFVAASGTDGEAKLFSVPFAGGTPAVIDNAETFHLNQAGDKIVYSKPVGGDGELFVRSVPSTGEPVQITNNEQEDLLPQWNKQGNRIVFARDKQIGQEFRFDLYTISPTGTNETQLTATDDQDERGASFNSAGDAIAYSAIGGPTTGDGLYRVPVAGGTRVAIKQTDGILDGTYWTTANGRSGNGAYYGLTRRLEKRKKD
jgi:hypothetical protein